MPEEKLPKLPYAHDALEPYIDARTMEIHHTKHHNAYITNLNNALKDQPKLQEVPLGELLSDLALVPEPIRAAVRNNGGGHINHSFFWSLMGPGKGGEPVGELADAVKRTFGTFGDFQKSFEQAALTRFGSGWAWLSSDREGGLEVHSTANQDTPLSDGRVPIVGLDVWEHAYYLKYQNLRGAYAEAWWNVVDWEVANDNYRKARG